MDHIIFAIDWPFVSNKPGMDWLKTLQISRDDMTKMLSGNATRLLKL